jgi:hypothetical protein
MAGYSSPGIKDGKGVVKAQPEEQKTLDWDDKEGVVFLISSSKGQIWIHLTRGRPARELELTRRV